MHKTTLYLEDGLYAKIRQLADAKDRTQASVIREAVAEYFSGKKRKPRSIGMGHSKARDLSDRAEALLEGFGDS
jgi:predicted transcriptional regulator